MPNELVELPTLEERFEARLVAVSRLASVGQLADGVAHELNNVAMILSGAIMMVEDAVQENRAPEADTLPDLQLVLSLMTAQARHLGALCQPPARAPESLDLGVVITSTLDRLRVMGCIKHLDLVASLPPEPVVCSLNRTGFEQLITALVLNANDAVAGRGKGCGVRVKLSRQGSRVTLAVEDDGAGLSPAVAAQLFEPFVTSKPTGRGTGLGLSAAHHIVRAFGGTLRFERPPGGGARFVVDFPEAAVAEAA